MNFNDAFFLYAFGMLFKIGVLFALNLLTLPAFYTQERF